MRHLIGSVSVDSGQLMIVDPGYLDRWKANEFAYDHTKSIPAPSGEFSYDGACLATVNAPGFGMLDLDAAAVFSSGYGDGYYPVYAEKNREGRVVRVVIEMNETEEDV